MIISKVIISLLIVLGGLLAFFIKKIDLKGSVSGIALAFIIWFGSGEVALLSLFAFFVVGTIASSWKKDQKAQLKLAQENDGKRGVYNVLANGGAAGVLSFFAFMLPEYHYIFFLMVLTSFSAACSDTLSSELGNVYGKNYFNILTLKPAPRGMDGVVSMEGFGFGIAGSIMIASLPLIFQVDIKVLLIVSISGFLGNIIDSILGATLQQKGILNNHSVNFFATLSSAFITFFFYLNF